MDDREDLLLFKSERDPEAVRRLFQRYEGKLYGYLLRLMRHPQDAEDVLATTFQKAYKALDRFQGDKYFKSWLFRIGHNEAVNALRRRNRQEARHTTMEDGNQAGRERDGFQNLDRDERAAALHVAILRLPQAEREVVLLRLEANLPFREISEQTGAPLGTVLARMHRAKQRLKTDLVGVLGDEPS